MSQPDTDAITAAFFALHDGLPRQSAGSDATTRRLLSLAGPLPERPRALDLGCGPGRSALLLADEGGAHVVGVDLHQPFLDELTAAAAQRGLDGRIAVMNCSMGALPFPDRGFDLIWAEGSVYNIGFDTALREWRRLLAPGGVLVVTEIEWTHPDPSPQARAFWDGAYPLRTTEQNVAAAEAAGYAVEAHWPLPEDDWWAEYYTPLGDRVAAADRTLPGMAEAAAASTEEITLRREHGGDYRYAGYVLRPGSALEGRSSWSARPETSGDVAAIRAMNLAAFPTAEEADLVEALRADPSAWIDGLSVIADAPDGTPAAYALLTRCRVGDAPALALGPCAVLPSHQRKGGGGAAIRAALETARQMGENLVVVLGHPEYYPRFGFRRASEYGISVSFDVPDEALMALALDASKPLPSGVVSYPAAFGV